MNAKEFNHPPQALILAGGKGERLLPLTRYRPKAAVPFGGAFRIIDFTLSNCVNSGLTSVALLTQHLHQDIQSYIRQEWCELWNRSGSEREPLVCLPPFQMKCYRGTADAVFQNISFFSSRESQHVLILSGDQVYRMDYSQFFRRHVETDADLTIATVEHPMEGATELGVVEVDKDLRVAGFSEKPSQPRSLPQRPDAALVSMGIYAFKVKTLADALNANCGMGSGYDFARHIIPSLIGSARVHAYSFRDRKSNAPGYWRDIGTIDSYYAASMDIVRPDGPFALNGDARCPEGFSPSWPAGNTTSVTRPRPQLSAEALLSHSVISHGVRIEGNAEIESSILLPYAKVASGARLRRVIVEAGVHIPSGFTAGWDLEADRRAHTVTPGGVVVVSETPRLVRPCTIPFKHETAAADPVQTRFTETCA